MVGSDFDRAVRHAMLKPTKGQAFWQMVLYVALAAGGVWVNAPACLGIAVLLAAVYGAVFAEKYLKDKEFADKGKTMPEELAIPQPRPHDAEGENDLFIP